MAFMVNRPARPRDWSPQLSVEGAVLDGFADVVDGDLLGGFEVGEGAGDAEDAVVGAGGELEVLDGEAEQVLGGLVELAEVLGVAGGHIGIAAGARAEEALGLAAAGLFDAGADGGRVLAGG